MKKALGKFFNKPGLVVVTSLIIAGGIGAYGYQQINSEPDATYVPTLEQTTVVSVHNNADATSNVTLGFLAGGRIRSVSVKTGDTVKKGQVLATLEAGNALGAIEQAKASYDLAQASYAKVVNGATGATVDVAKSSVHTAETNLEQVKKTQDVLVANAHKNYLNSTIVAKPVGDSTLTPPTISGVYSKNTEGTINIAVNQGGESWGYLTFTGLASGTGTMSTNTPQPIGDTGLYIQFPASAAYGNVSWTITVPNVTAPNYLANYNAYQSAMQAKDQAIANAQSALDQANVNLTALVTAARPEDVATAQAQVNNAHAVLEIAQAAYRNYVITAPIDGTVTAVNVSVGQIAIANAAAIELVGSTSSIKK